MRTLVVSALSWFNLIACSAEPILIEDADPVTSGRGLITSINEPWMQLEQSVGLYDNAGAAPIAPLLQSAAKQIDVEIYEMEDGEVLRSLTTARQQGVRVRILKDPKPIGQRCDPFNPDPSKVSCSALQLWLTAFVAAGGEIKPFDRLHLCGVPGKPCFEHGKLIVIDQRVAAISSGNFNSTNLCDLADRPKVCNRDYTYVTRDPEVVNAVSQIFENDWQGIADELPALLARGQLAEKLTVSPFSRAPLYKFLEGARTRIQFQNQYLTDADFAAKLIALKTARPDLEIELNFSDLCEYGTITETKAYKADLMFRAFGDAGITTRMFPRSELVAGHRGYLHAKAIVVDGQRAWIGSTNGSAESLDRNREYGLFFSQPERVKELSDQLAADFNSPQAKTWQESVDQCPRKKAKFRAQTPDEAP